MGWPFPFFLALVAALTYAVARATTRTKPRSRAMMGDAPPAADREPQRRLAGDWPGLAPVDPRQAIYDLADGAHADLSRAARASHLVGCQGFEACVEAMRESPLSDADLFDFYTSDSLVLAVCAAEALARRPIGPEIRDRLVQALNEYHPYTRFFGLRAIAAGTPATESVLGLVLPAIDESWQGMPLRTMLADFVVERVAAGDPPRVENLSGELTDETCDTLAGLLGQVHEPRVAEFLAALAALRAGRVDKDFLRSVGTLGAPADDEILVEHPDLAATRDLVVAALTAAPPRPVLLVGLPGTGRDSLVLAVCRVLRDAGWSLFRAGHMELIAGQSFMGQFENRVRRLMDELGRSRRTLWVANFFQAFLFAGRHSASPTNLLDLILPAVAEGRFPMIAVTEPAGLDLLARNKPDVLTAFEIVRLEPLSEAESLAVAREWDRRRDRPPPPLDDATLREASHLAQQYLGDTAPPGNLLRLLKSVTRDRAEAGGAAVTTDDLIACVGALTRLPAAILDERQPLDLDELRRFFTTRVIGQPEAVDALVERVAMIKAGVTDPTRPLGVFLFAGPTGTGKTEIAKALAEYLCGSPQRLVRIDMSELQTPDSLARLLGDDQRDHAGHALVDQIRRNPFSVVLLDEFEKSHPQVWDLFLQVFDDGRLTDRRGITADFRNCVILLTSNLGSAVPTGPGLGFGGGGRPVAESVERAVARAFRPEFFNRIDRVVVFRPLSREVLREILHKELHDVFGRRGLRNRDWAVVWDETALDFLLDRGTTPDLGARPLKRAIEQHVLAPLARTIVEHEYPRGDQFLFVRSGGAGLEVEFVDPDAEPPAPARPPAAEAETPRLESLALDPRGDGGEVACLESHLGGLVAAIEDPTWRDRKRAALDRQHEPGFWDSPARFAVFGTVEQMDRIEGGVRSAARFFERLHGGPAAGRTRLAGEHAGRLALRLFLLETAVTDVIEARPLDAFVMVEAADSGDPRRPAASGFRVRLVSMYRAWGERRGMKIDTVLDEDGGGGRPPRIVLAVSGLAAHTLLAPEAGLHLAEEPAEEGRAFERVQLRVRVAPQPEVPPTDADGGLRGQALAVFEAQAAAPLQVVRRYRERPSPLVRDAVRGWRTGRIDRVLAGDFDLLAATRGGDEPMERDDEPA